MKQTLFPALLLFVLHCTSAHAKGSLKTYAKYKINATTNIMEIDSTRWTYSGGRSGDLQSVGGIPFDSALNYAYAAGTLPKAGMVSVKHYNAVGLVDTETNYWASRTIRFYNAAGKLIQADFQSGNSSTKTFTNGLRQFTYYNTAGLDSLRLTRIWNAASSTWDNDNRTQWTYNSAGKITQITMEQWNTMSSGWDGQMRTTNNYNSAGLLTDDMLENWTSSTSWTLAQRRYNTYSGTRMIKQITERYAAGVWSSTDSALYTSSGSPVVTNVTTTYSKYGSAAYVPYQRLTTAVNPAGNLNAHIWERGGTTGFSNYQYTYYAYNNDNQLVRQYMETWNGSTWAYEPKVSYEMLYTYGNSTGIPTTSGGQATALDLRISPIPASGSISLHLIMSRPAGYEASISDLNGKQLRSWTGLSTSANYSESVSIATLVPGVYYLNVQSRDGHDSRAFVVQ